MDGIPPSRITSLNVFALSPAQRRRGGEALTDFWARRNRAFCRAVVRRGFGQARAVYAFNGAALEIFEAAKARGLTTLLDQTAAPWRWNKKILLEEASRWPGWEDQPAEIDTSDALALREEREWELADAIICGSSFAAAAVLETGGSPRRCAVVPYARHTAALETLEAKVADPDRPLRVLFAGTLQLRKGVQYLFEAAHLLKGEPVTIRFVGPSLLSGDALRRLRGIGEIAGPVSRSEMERQYAWADVLVLPTLSEGSANVCLEAAARGLPVITTPNAGSAIVHGRTGLIVPARDARALAESIALLLRDAALRCRLTAAPIPRHPEDALEAYGRGLEACLASAVRRCSIEPDFSASFDYAGAEASCSS